MNEDGYESVPLIEPGAFCVTVIAGVLVSVDGWAAAWAVRAAKVCATMVLTLDESADGVCVVGAASLPSVWLVAGAHAAMANAANNTTVSNLAKFFMIFSPMIIDDYRLISLNQAVKL